MKSHAVLCGLFISLFAVLPAFAAPDTYETEVINSLRVGDIAIHLAEYEYDDTGREVPYHDPKTVLPGQSVSKIVRVTNLANPAWIRVRLEFAGSDDLFYFPESCMVPADERWVMRGGIWYLTSPLGSGEEVDLISELCIPPSWDESQAGMDLRLIITAEAVQEANFDPDFDSEDPWFGTLIETCVHSGSVPVTPRSGPFSITFEGGAQGMIKTGEDFFENFGSLMPGDTASDTLTLKNDYSKPVSIYFRTEGREDDALSHKARLTIQTGAGMIFDGSLAESREEVKIAVLKKGEEEKITYSVFIPPEADNSFAMEMTTDKWIFRAEPDAGKKSSSSGGGHTGSGQAAAAHPSPTRPLPAAEFIYPVRELAKTGEGKAFIYAAALMAMSGIFLFLILKKKHTAGAGKKQNINSETTKHESDIRGGNS